MLSVIISIYLLLAIATLYVEISQIKEERIICMSIACRLFYIALQFLVPMLLMGMYLFGNIEKDFLGYTIDYSDYLTLLLRLFCSSVGYVALYFASKHKKNRLYKEVIFYQEDKVEQTGVLFVTALILFAIGFISLCIWTSAYGGIFEFIKVSDIVRSGQGKVENKLAFFSRGAKTLIISSYLFFVLMKNKKNSFAIRFITFILFVANLYATVLYLLSVDGRLLVAFYIFGFFLIYYYTKSNKKGSTLFSKIMFSLIIILLVYFTMKMDDITYYIRYGHVNNDSDGGSALDSFLSETMFVLIGEQTYFQNVWLKGDYYIFNEITNGLFAWFPSSLKPIPLQSVWKVNSELLNYSATMPFGVVGQGLYSLGLIGAFIMPFILGKAIKICEKKIKGGIFDLIIYVVLLEAFLRSVAYGSFYDIILGQFSTVVALIVFYFVKSCFTSIKKV